MCLLTDYVQFSFVVYMIQRSGFSSRCCSSLEQAARSCHFWHVPYITVWSGLKTRSDASCFGHLSSLLLIYLIIYKSTGEKIGLTRCNSLLKCLTLMWPWLEPLPHSFQIGIGLSSQAQRRSINYFDWAGVGISLELCSRTISS